MLVMPAQDRKKSPPARGGFFCARDPTAVPRRDSRMTNSYLVFALVNLHFHCLMLH